MKSIFKITMVLAMIVFASAGYAGVDPYIKVKGDKLFSVHHNSIGEFHFAIKEQSGKVIYAIKGNKSSKFVKTFDVKNLPIGRYILVAKQADGVNTYALQITSEGLSINKNQPLTSAR